MFRSKSFIQLSFLIILFTIFAGYSFMNAASVWTPPPATPTGNNVDAPINTGEVYQAKLGDLGAVTVSAGKFCNPVTNVCATVEEMLADSGSSQSIQFTYTNSFNQLNPSGTSKICSCANGDNITSCEGGSIVGNSCTSNSGSYPSCSCLTTVTPVPSRTCKVEFVTAAPNTNWAKGASRANTQKTYTEDLHGKETDSVVIIANADGEFLFTGENTGIRYEAWRGHEYSSSYAVGEIHFDVVSARGYKSSKVGFDNIDQFDVRPGDSDYAASVDFDSASLLLKVGATAEVRVEGVWADSTEWMTATVKSCTS